MGTAGPHFAGPLQQWSEGLAAAEVGHVGFPGVLRFGGRWGFVIPAGPHYVVRPLEQCGGWWAWAGCRAHLGPCVACLGEASWCSQTQA